MIVGKAIYYLLTNATDVTDIVNTRVYPEVAQQDAALPYIVYNVTNNEPTDTKPEPSKLDTAQVEVNIYSDSYTEAIDLAVAVRAALDRVKGTYNGVNVQSIQYLNEIIDFDEPQRAYNINADYDVRISRSGFEIAQGSPITGVELGELSDVNVAGATDNQVLSYDAATDTWVAADDAGGAEVLNDLTDVDAGQPEADQLLSYGQGGWTTIDQDQLALPIGSVTGLQAALDATPDNLRELTDVTISGLVDNDYLQYDSASGTWQNSSLILGRNGEQYTGNYDSEAETLRAGATATVELYYTAQADGDGYAESAESDTATTGFDIRRKLYYSEAAQADCDSGTWVQFADIPDDTTFASAKATLLAYLKERTGGTVPISLKMTWEEVAEAPTFTGLLNESYGSGAAAAYSVRRLNGLYTGSAIEVERSSDNTTQDIGFDVDGNLDESALTTFCTGTTCKVRTWYDQSQTGGTGSGNDAVQTVHANQPTIYTGGAIVKDNGRVAFSASSDFLEASSISSGSEDRSVYIVYHADTVSNTNQMFDFSDSSSSAVGSVYTVTTEVGVRCRNTTYVPNGGNTDRNLLSIEQDISESPELHMYLSGTETGSGGNISENVIAGATRIMGSGQTNTYDGLFQEILIYAGVNGDKSTDRTQIESNIGDYFTQNTPLLDTYSGAAAAYSLRKLRTAYTGSAIRVRRASDNTEQDIGFNVFGELDTVSLASFCSGTDGFVKTWYDQSGSANDATQTTAASQPKIYDSVTGVVTEGTKPAINLDSNDFFDLGSLSAASGDNVSYYWVGDWTGETTHGNRWILHADDTVSFYLAPISQNGITTDGYAGLSSVTGYKDGVSVAVATRDNVHDAFTNVYHLGELYGTTTTAFSSTELGRFPSGNTFYLNGNLQEFILYTSDQSSNRTNIEDNINTFYSIY